MKYKQSEKTNKCKSPNKTKTLQFDSRVSGNPERFLRGTAEPLSEPWHQLHFSGKSGKWGTSSRIGWVETSVQIRKHMHKGDQCRLSDGGVVNGDAQNERHSEKCSYKERKVTWANGLDFGEGFYLLELTFRVPRSKHSVWDWPLEYLGPITVFEINL